MRSKIRAIAAWTMALGLLGYLLRRSSVVDVVHAARLAAPWTIPALVLLTVVVYLADTLAICRIFGWFLARLSFREVLIVRGATYLLAVISYAVGQGCMVYFVNRSRGTPIAKGAGAVLLIMGTNLLLLLLFATAGLALSGEVPRALPAAVAVAYGGLAVYVAVVALKPRWLTRKPLLGVLVDAGLRGHLKATAIRVPHLMSLLAFNYVGLRAFGIDVPVGHAVLCLPVVYFIAVLPISPAGLGTTQAAMTLFFGRYAPTATILASSLAAQGVALAVQALIGLACLRSQIGRQLPAQDLPAVTTP
jgi:hypothetical protein